MRAHLFEMFYKPGTVERAVYDATKNIAIWKDAPGVAIVDWDKTQAAKAEVAAQVRREFEEKSKCS